MAARAILHLDMDAFYASVEQRDAPALKGKPVIVGGHPTRGVVLAASYEIRPFGVRSAMPMARALRLCPEALVVPPRFEAYVTASDQVAQVLAEVTPLIEPLSLDEAFLDVTASLSLFGPPAAIAKYLRERIAREIRLPASAGIAACKFVAKIATDFAKPNGQHEVLAEQTVAFLSPLPVGRLWGVGPKTEDTLRRLGIKTIGDLRERGEDWLAARLGDQGRAFHALSLGVDDRPVVPDRQQKSIGAEDTFSQDTLDAEFLKATIHAQSWRVGRRLRRAGLRARVVEVKLKDLDFKISHRRSTLPEATDDGQEIFRTTQALLARAAPARPLRLIGVAACELSEGDDAPRDLFAALGSKQHDRSRRNALNAAIDRINDKFGPSALRPLDLLEGSVGERGLALTGVRPPTRDRE
jgi:DNA polymerase IV